VLPTKPLLHMDTKIIGICVRRGTSQLTRGLRSCQLLSKFSTILSTGFNGTYDGAVIEEVFIGVILNRFDPDVMENVPSDMSLGDAIAYNSAFSSILFVLERVDVEQQRVQVDALPRLMNASAVCDRLPELKQDASNGRERVHNFVVEYLRRRSESARFSAQQQDAMKMFMTALVNVL